MGWKFRGTPPTTPIAGGCVTIHIPHPPSQVPHRIRPRGSGGVPRKIEKYLKNKQRDKHREINKKKKCHWLKSTENKWCSAKIAGIFGTAMRSAIAGSGTIHYRKRIRRAGMTRREKTGRPPRGGKVDWFLVRPPFLPLWFLFYERFGYCLK